MKKYINLVSFASNQVKIETTNQLYQHLKQIYAFLATLLICNGSIAQNTSDLKQQANQYLAEMEQFLCTTSDSIWTYSEPTLKEYKTVDLLKTVLVDQGFSIRDSVVGFETMFIAAFGTKGPTIALLAEGDADSPLVPQQGFWLPDSQYGQAAGHHLLATGSLGTVLTLKELIKNGGLEARLMYAFSTGEGSFGGRVPLVRAGYFSEVDLAFFWHPAPVTTASLSQWDAIFDVEVTYPNTQQSHKNIQQLWALADSIKQEYGNDLLFRTKIMNTAFDLAIPTDSLKIHLRIEHPRQEQAMEIYHGIVKKLRSGKSNSPHFQVFRAVHEFIPNLAGNHLAYLNMTKLPSRKILDSDLELAQKIWRATQKDDGRFLPNVLPFKENKAKRLYGYGSDIGDVSWHVPLISIVTSCLPTGVSMRNWEGAAFGQTQYAKDGMLHAAKAMVFTCIDYLTNKEIQKQIHGEFEQRIRNRIYQDSIEIRTNEFSYKRRSY